MENKRMGMPQQLTQNGCCASPYGYIIGLQNGHFPSFGGHVEGEMGGVWIHPIKLLDGFWLKLNGETVSFNQYEILPYGQRFKVLKNGLSITRFDFMPHTQKGAVICYTLENTTDDVISLEADFWVRFHLSPVWFSEHKGYGDAPDSAEVLQNSILLGRDGAQPWFAAVQAAQVCDGRILHDKPSPDQNSGHGKTAALCAPLVIAAHQACELIYYIAGSYHSSAEALGELKLISQNAPRLLMEKKKHAQSIEDTAHISTDNEALNAMLLWVKFNTDWLVQTVDEYGTGLAAGIPEYVWWFGCDNAYALQGCLAAGMIELCKQTARLLKRFSMQHNGNGRIVHEISTYGVVSNPGNTQETAHFITMVRKIWDWTGDSAFLSEMYDTCKLGIEWLLSQTSDDNPIPLGYGIMEIEGLNVRMIDVAVYTAQALLDMYTLSTAMGEPNAAYKIRGQALKDYINCQCFIQSEGQYCDGVATPKQLLARMDKLKQRAQEHSKCSNAYIAFLEKQEKALQEAPDMLQPFLLAKNWVIFTPIEAGLAYPPYAARALSESFHEDYLSPYGQYLSALMKDHVMTISTGVRAVAEARAKRMDASYHMLECLLSTFEKVMPGAISEMSPDYGCFVQAWTIYAALVPVVEGFAGIHADAASRTITVCPILPEKLNRLDIDHLPIGDGEISVHIRREKDGVQVDIQNTLRSWQISLLPFQA